MPASATSAARKPGALRLLAYLFCVAVAGCATNPAANKLGPASTVSSAPVQKPQPPVDLYAEIAKYVHAGDRLNAVKAFRAAISAHPDDLETQVQLAHYLLSGGQIDEARSVLDSVFAKAPASEDALYTMALLEGAAGNPDKEQSLLEAFVKSHPADAQALATLGEIYQSKQMAEKAKASFQAALQRDPKNVAALEGYGMSLLTEGDATAAAAQFGLAIAAQPDFSFVYADRAQARVRLDDLDGAEQDFARAIQLNPGYYWHYVDRGKLRLMFESNMSGALDDFSKAIDINPTYFLGYVYRAGIYDDQDNLEAAAADYAMIMKLRPDYYFIYQPYAVLLYLKQDWSHAHDLFVKAFASTPDDYGLAVLGAICSLRAGDKQAAASFLATVAAKIPRDDPFYGVVRLYLDPSYEPGFVNQVQGIRNIEVQTRMLFYLATYYLIQGHTDLAQQYYLDVQDHRMQGMYEYRINEAELAKYTKNK